MVSIISFRHLYIDFFVCLFISYLISSFVWLQVRTFSITFFDCYFSSACWKKLLPIFHLQWAFGHSYKENVIQDLVGPSMKPLSQLLWSNAVKPLLKDISQLESFLYNSSFWASWLFLFVTLFNSGGYSIQILVIDVFLRQINDICDTVILLFHKYLGVLL